ncbi:VanZ family protein [Pelagicoccus mobilis]|uniref:VanZ family protein n=1 Tax=Pelagicoccus mobilis TaxID=415221 RepID=A0A934RUP0_9BACT|nr:VanZ family protein [Pelagicoccus mobilis]MBK1876748.1 VanZ family protein [Pelagicoccus mobilis]
MSQRKRKAFPSTLRAWLPPLLTCALLSAYSCKTGPIAPEIDFSLRDKLDHFCVYGLLAILVLRALPNRFEGTTRWLTAFALVSLFGMWDETLQHFNSARTGDPLDWFADSLGALTAVVLYTEIPLLRAVANWQPSLGPNHAKSL